MPVYRITFKVMRAGKEPFLFTVNTAEGESPSAAARHARKLVKKLWPSCTFRKRRVCRNLQVERHPWTA